MKIERDLIKLVPRADWARFPHLLIWHGRRVCDARRPRLRALRRERPVPVEPRRRLRRREAEQQPAVLVVGGEEVALHLLLDAGAGAERELLVELAHAPLAHGLDRGGVGEPERLRDVAPEQVALAEAGQLEDALAGCEDAAILVGDDEAGGLRRVVVLEQLEREREPALLARGRLRRQSFVAVVVEAARLAAGADEVRHLDPAYRGRWP